MLSRLGLVRGSGAAARAAGRWARCLFIQTQTTPSEDAVKFLPGMQILPEGAAHEFGSIRAASQAPLARRLFAVDGVRSVFFGSDFITVTKQHEIRWEVLRPEIFEAIAEHASSGQPYIDLEGGDGAAHVHSDTTILETDDEVVAMIKELLETRVKPAVAEDGGNILYRGFHVDSGVVDLELQGACSSCSSSSITLKMGVENMLKHYVPEVKAVREVKSEAQEEGEKAFSDLEARLSQAGMIRD